MNISANISNNIKRYRKERQLSQEALAEKLGVTSQAVSKWECMQSIPDIEALVEISELLEISLDKLVLDREAEAVYKQEAVENEPDDTDRDEDPADDGDDGPEDTEVRGGGDHYNRKGFWGRRYFDALPDDEVLRVLQFKGRLMLTENTYNKNAVIGLALDPAYAKKKIVDVRVVGNAHIEGNISGSVNVGDHLVCGNVSGSVKAGDSINCGNVSGSVRAGDSVNCGIVGGSVSAGDGVSCGNVNGNVVAGDGVRCGDVKIIQRCGGDIHCKTVHSCNGKVHINIDD